MLADLLNHDLAFDPSGDWDAFLKNAPARWVVYLLADQNDQPVQLLCVKNLRASLKRRLGGAEVVGPTRKVNYRQIVGRVHWRRVDSAFEADLVYLEAARRAFPQTYRGMLGLDPPWFVHVDPSAPFPRYVKTNRLDKPGILIGPIADKHAAARFIELIEDAFDLCRYYNILTQAPQGRACAYKEMGKCPAPCDGTISMDAYRQLVQHSAATAIDPQPALRELKHRMAQAAAELNFESAGKIKSFAEQIGQLAKGSFACARRMEDFQYLALQPGPAAGTAKAFVILFGVVEEIAGLIGPPTSASTLLSQLFTRSNQASPDRSEEGAQRIAIVADHLLHSKKVGVFLRLDQLDDKTLLRAWNDLLKQVAKSPAEESEEEGMVKELQQL